MRCCSASNQRHAIGIGEKQFGKDLDRDVASELRVGRAIHLTHAAGAKGGDDLVRR